YGAGYLCCRRSPPPSPFDRQASRSRRCSVDVLFRTTPCEVSIVSEPLFSACTMGSVEKRRMCPNCRAFITVDDRICPYCDLELGGRAVDRRSPGDIAGGMISHARFTTVVLLLINACLYVLTAVYSMKASGGEGALDIDPRTLYIFGAKFQPNILAGQWWRLITAGFLHGGILHILMNSWVIFDLGATVEEFFGTARYLSIYFCATVLGFLPVTLWA